MTAKSGTEPEGEPKARSTRQRRAIAAQLDTSHDFRSAQEIHEALRAAGERVGLATVYRALQAMADIGEIDMLVKGGETVYRRCSGVHHHHLVCRLCGRTIEITGPAVERWARAVAEEHNFAEVNHELELFGVCPECQRAG